MAVGKPCLAGGEVSRSATVEPNWGFRPQVISGQIDNGEGSMVAPGDY